MLDDFFADPHKTLKEAGLNPDFVFHSRWFEPNFTEFECLICGEEYKKNDGTCLMCGHCYCNDCWSQNLEIKVTKGINTLKNELDKRRRSYTIDLYVTNM